MRELTRNRLAAEAAAVADTLRDDLLATYAEGGAVALARTVAIRADRGGGAVVLLAGPGGRAISGDLAAWPPTLPAPADGVRIRLYRVGADRPEEMRVSAVRLRDGYRLLTGHVIEGQIRFTSVMERASAVALVLAVALAAFAAWLTARIVEGRLRRTVAVARAVEGGQLDARVAVEGGVDAFDELGLAVNRMLDRIDVLLTELKVATDALAHDLKSPLARMRAALERTALLVEGEAAEAAVERALAEGERLLATVELSLRISRAEAGIGAETFRPVDLSALLEDVAEVYGPLAEERGFTIDADAPPGLMLPAHRELLGQAIANLVDNALKYGAGTIRMTARDRDGRVVLSVSDRGPGIAPERREAALRRFGRLDEARGGSGAGLGLSLVAAVARLHGGVVRLGDAGPGLLVELDLPRPA